MEKKGFILKENVKGIEIDPFQDLLITVAEGEG